MSIDPKVRNLAQKLWDYLKLDHPLEKSDGILVFGNNDIRVAERAAQLYLDGLGPFILFSGGLGNLTKGIWRRTEADTFAKIAMEMGVPREDIMIENQSAHTGENIAFTYGVFKRKDIRIHRALLVHTPYMERRSYAAFIKQWPDRNTELVVTSPQISFEDYPNDKLPFDMMVHLMVGIVERIQVYAEEGFQISQDIPSDIWQAYEELVNLGYTEQLVKS